MDKDTLEVLGIKDFRVIQDPKFSQSHTNQKVNDTNIATWYLFLSDPHNPHCALDGFPTTKYGTYTAHHFGPPAPNGWNIWQVRKQRYRCGHCGHTQSAELKDVAPNFKIAKAVLNKAVTLLTEDMSQETIARQLGISPHTVMRSLKPFWQSFRPDTSWLPKNLAIDDWRSGKFAKSKMSLTVLDNDTHQIFDVLPNRQNVDIDRYFSKFPLEQRLAVETITTDLFEAYPYVLKKLFPNAKLIADPFHVVQLAFRHLQQSRIALMKQFDKTTTEYRLLKQQRRTLTKKHQNIDPYEHYKYSRLLKAQVNEHQLLDDILTFDDQLKRAYWFYQNLMYYTKNHNVEMFTRLIQADEDDSDGLTKVKETLRRHLQHILNHFDYPQYTNGPIEGIHNKIKNIKRTAYGFRNWEYFRLRILLAGQFQLRF
jgi:transposase